MDEKNIKKEFFRFLKDKNAFTSFKKEFIAQESRRFEWVISELKLNHKFEDGNVKSFNGYFNSIADKKFLITWAFSWNNTEEGYEFWENLHNEWFGQHYFKYS